MFSHCVFVCVCVCLSVYVCHDVCPDDLALNDWCNTNNILQVYTWGYRVVQVMFHALVTSSMTSLGHKGHKVGQILKCMYLRQYFSYRIYQKLKISGWYIQLPVKKFVATSKWRPFWKFRNIEHFDLRCEKIVPNYAPKSFFHGDDVINNVAGWPQSRSSIFMFGRGSFREQVTRTMSRQYMRIS